jgi:hypothetical protein
MEDSSDVQPSKHQEADATAEEDQATKKVEYGSHTVRTVPQITPPPATPSEATCSKKDETPRWKKVLEFSAIALAFIVAVIYGGQLWVMKQQLTEMKRSGESATDQMWSAIRNMNWMARSMDNSVQQSSKALEASIAASYLDERAWVSIKSVTLSTPYFLNRDGQITITLANSGKTPALEVGIAKASFGPVLNALLARPHEVGRMTIAPGSATDTMFISVPPEDPRTKVYLRIIIEYWDIFQKRTDPPRSTAFCGYYPTTQPPFFFNSNSCGTMK